MNMNKTLWIFCALLIALQLTACFDDSSNGSDQAAILTTGNPAIDDISAKIVKNPEEASLYASRAEAFYNIEGYDEAIADLARAMQLDSTKIDYYHLLADVYLDYYQSKRALKTMELAAAKFPKRVPTLLKLAEFQMILKQSDESLLTVTRILELEPNNAEAFVMMGMNFEQKGEEARAINSYQIAVEKDPDLADIWIRLGQLFAKRDNPIAIRYFDNGIEAAPMEVQPIYAKAEYLHLNNKFDEALELLKEVTNLDPQFVEGYFRMGIIYLEMDSIDQAYKHFDIVVKIDPALPKGYYYRAYTSERKGNIESAKNDYQQTLNLDPKFDRAQAALDKLKQ
jgi:tetratricopeptide (TPR) repeat protein